MNDIATMAALLLVGFMLGGFFFGGLLVTVKRGLAAKSPAIWFMGSWVIRIAVVMGAFYVVSAGQWERILVCFAGFFIARFVVIRCTRTTKKTDGPNKETGDAS